MPPKKYQLINTFTTDPNQNRNFLSRFLVQLIQRIFQHYN